MEQAGFPARVGKSSTCRGHGGPRLLPVWYNEELMNIHPASFRDPSGFVFLQDGQIFRRIQTGYRSDYDYLMISGLYGKLTGSGLMVPHAEVETDLVDGAYKTIRPEMIPFISYPYEWCFSQLKDAALTTLKIQQIALDHQMVLKDASAYNIQFLRGKPVLIDTLSFTQYREGEPWIAYRQFCQHFLAPLALQAYQDVRLNQLLRIYIDGIPLDLASSLLPRRTKWKLSLAAHIHLHAKSQKHYSDKQPKKTKVGRLSLIGFLDSLQSSIRKLKWNPEGTEWGDYYEDTNYSSEALDQKKQLVAGFLETLKPQIVWDLGANTGVFSRLASTAGAYTVAFDLDPAAVEKNYREMVQRKETNLLPLLLDLTNPSPGAGFENMERMSLFERAPAETVLALALIHHLAISNNVPMARLAAFFRKLCKSLIIEFVPKEDSQVRRLLSTREDIFPNYNQEHFESEFKKHFVIEKAAPITGSQRTLYLMR